MRKWVPLCAAAVIAASTGGASAEMVNGCSEVHGNAPAACNFVLTGAEVEAEGVAVGAGFHVTYRLLYGGAVLSSCDLPGSSSGVTVHAGSCGMSAAGVPSGAVVVCEALPSGRVASGAYRCANR